MSEGSSAGQYLNLEVNLSYCIDTPDEDGMTTTFEFGDVFEHVDTMVRLGEQIVGQIEQQVNQGRISIGGERVNAIPLASAKEGGSEMSLQVNDRILYHKMRRFDPPSNYPQTLPPYSCRSSEEICTSALQQILGAHHLRRRNPSEEGGSHDIDISAPGFNEPPVRVELTKLTSEMAEQWGKRTRSGNLRTVRTRSDELKYHWHASINMTDTLFRPAWRSLVKNARRRRRTGAEIDRALLEHVLWIESQMGTLAGALSLANQRIRPNLKPGDRLLVFPFFRAQNAPRDGHGGLTVSYDVYSVDYSTIGSSKATDPINQVISRKAEKNQAGALLGEKWLVVYLHPVYAIAAILDVEAHIGCPTSWLAFESKIDRRHFDEVWLVWDKQRARDDTSNTEGAINVVRFSARDTQHVVCP
ncbi:MAG: hypothetical protein OXH28_02195 [bacterium]|nr:hypothetical protein [bacterium]